MPAQELHSNIWISKLTYTHRCVATEQKKKTWNKKKTHTKHIENARESEWELDCLVVDWSLFTRQMGTEKMMISTHTNTKK